MHSNLLGLKLVLFLNVTWSPWMTIFSNNNVLVAIDNKLALLKSNVGVNHYKSSFAHRWIEMLFEQVCVSKI